MYPYVKVFLGVVVEAFIDVSFEVYLSFTSSWEDDVLDSALFDEAVDASCDSILFVMEEVTYFFCGEEMVLSDCLKYLFIGCFDACSAVFRMDACLIAPVDDCGKWHFMVF